MRYAEQPGGEGDIPPFIGGYGLERIEKDLLGHILSLRIIPYFKGDVAIDFVEVPLI
jgi:hypothetical protein